MIIVKGEIWLTADQLDAESRNFDAATDVNMPIAVLRSAGRFFPHP
jgi:hypothetical protein